MEIADLVVINKYDGEYKRICERLKRQIESALTLSMSKHMYSDIYQTPVNWATSVELVSAHSNTNVDTIWKYAQQMRATLGERNLALLRQDQMKRGMWDFLSECLLQELKQAYGDETSSDSGRSPNKYASVVREVEGRMLRSEIGGHEAAQKILDAILFKRY